MKRNLTHLEERIIRYHHHEFKGLTFSETAKVCELTEPDLRAALAEIKRKAPQLFPILTPRQVAVRTGWENNLSQAAIAAGLELTEAQVKQDYEFLRVHKFVAARPVTVAYADHMDDKIIQRF